MHASNDQSVEADPGLERASEQTNEGNGQTAEGAKKSSACTLWCSISIIIKSFLAFAKKI